MTKLIFIEKFNQLGEDIFAFVHTHSMGIVALLIDRLDNINGGFSVLVASKE